VDWDIESAGYEYLLGGWEKDENAVCQDINIEVSLADRKRFVGLYMLFASLRLIASP
jgi:hypothetical protein